MTLPAKTSMKPWLLLALLLAASIMGYFLLNRPSPVTGYALEMRPVVQRVIASGVVKSDAVTQIGSELTATVKKRHVREGDKVKQGQLLLELNSDREQAQLRQAQADLDEAISRQRPQAKASLTEAELALTQAQAELNRREQLATKSLVSKEQLEQARLKLTQAKTARDNAQTSLQALSDKGSVISQLQARVTEATAALAKTQIVAPTDGTVLTRSVEAGDQVQAGRTLLTLAQAGIPEIIVPVDEKLIAPIQLNQSATLIADAYPDQVLQGSIYFIAPNVDTNRGSLDVHIRLDEPYAFLRQGMTVTANIETKRLERALVVSNDVLIERTQNDAWLFVENAGKAEKRHVRLGLQTTTASVIEHGLNEGDIVLSGAKFDGQKVNVTLKPLPEAFGR